jgi:hypothetical protein
MFPLRDENPVVRAPVATIVLIAVNVAVWIFVQGLGSPNALARSVCVYGLIPGELLGTAAPGAVIPLGPQVQCVLQGSGSLLTPLTSMFMHGGWFHIIGNLWFLWIFGDNVEDAMGRFRFVAFYLICGIAAAAAQMFTQPDSIVPMVGASGDRDAGVLVSASGARGPPHPGRCRGGRGVLGPCGRLCRGCRTDRPVSPRRLPVRPPCPALAQNGSPSLPLAREPSDAAAVGVRGIT